MSGAVNSSNQDNKSAKSKSAGSERKQAPLSIFLLDSAKDFASPQSELLALALRLKELGFVPHVCCPASSMLMQKASEQKLRTVSILGENDKKPGLFALLKLFWRQKRSQPVCIHSFAEDCLPLVQRLIRLRPENSTLILHTCFDLPKQNAKVLPAYWALPKKIVYPSKYIANAWAKVGIDPAQVEVIYTACDNLTSQPKGEVKRWIFVALEPLEENSGIDFLLKAMSALWQHPHLPQWEVRVVGTGSCFEQVFAEAESLGVSSRLALLGEQPLENILPYAQVIINTHSGAQGNIAALMAAWSACLPVICTSVSAHMEVVNAGNAFILPTLDPQRLAAVMIEFMSNPERREHYGKLSSSMHGYANISRLLEQYSSLYYGCIARHGWVLPAQNKIQEQE